MMGSMFILPENMYLYINVCAHVEARGRWQVNFLNLSSVLLGQGHSLSLEPISLARVVGQ